MANVSALPAVPAIPPQIGRYKIVCELGQGGMGTIYLGRAEGIGGFERLMAIKMIHPHLSRQQSFIDMFLDEARIAALIRHPNVVPVYEIGEHEGRHFIAMDYVSGEPLSILLDNTWCRGVPLDFDIVAYIVSIVCEALHAAHDLTDPTGRPLKVVHRDVCPQNIMLGYDGVTRVMDFGVAKAVDQLSETRPGTHKGKVPYMAPEQIRCQRVDRRSDIFSLGVVLWESTIGQRLFKAGNDILSASKVLKGKVPRPTKAREGFPPELEEIVLKALNPKADKRYQTAREMGQALREYLAHRAALVSSSDVESLLKATCARRYEQRREIEQQAANRPFDAGPIEEDTTRLFATGDTNLPSFEAVAVQSEQTRDALRSAVSSREVYEYDDEEMDDRTVRTELEELGFISTAEFELLENDRDAPPTVMTGLPKGRTEEDGHQSTIRDLVAKSDEAAAEADLGREMTPLVKLDLVGGKRGISIVVGALAAALLVAFGIAAAVRDDPPAPKDALVEQMVSTPKRVEPTLIEPAHVEPKKVEPKKVEPRKAEPRKAEPNKAKTVEAEPKKAQVEEAEPMDLEDRPARRRARRGATAARVEKKRRAKPRPKPQPRSKPKAAKRSEEKKTNRLLVGADDL